MGDASDLKFLEIVLLKQGIDPKLVHEIEQVACKYPANIQIAFICKQLGAYQSTTAYLLDVDQSTVSRYLERLEEEVRKLLENRLKMHI